MEEIFNDPVIAHFFQSIKKENTIQVLKELVLLGIHSVSSKIHGTSNSPYANSNDQIISLKEKENIKPNTHNKHQGPTDSSNANERLADEISKIHMKIDQLAHNINKEQGQQNKSNIKIQSAEENKNWKSGFAVSTLRESHGGNYFRHHLDDSEIRMVLTNPFATEENIQLPKESSHEKQKHLDEEELRRIKTQANNFHKIQEESEEFDSENSRQEISENRGKYEKQSVSQSGKNKNKNKNKNKTVNVRSKIKSLLEKDKLKHQSNAFTKKVKNYCQFEYSDEEEFSGQIHELEKSQRRSAEKHCLVHSESNEEEEEEEDSYSEQSSQKMVKRENEKEKNSNNKSSNKKLHREEKGNKIEREKRSVSQSEAISESSSFSKFSMNSKREVGKISGI